MHKQTVNFLPLLAKEKRDYLDAKQSLVALGAILVLMVFYYSVTLWQSHTLRTQANTLKKEQGAISARMRQAQKTPQFVKALTLEKKVTELQRRMSAQNASFLDILKELAERNTAGFSAFLTGFSKAIMPNVWLTDINIDYGGGAILLMGKTSSSALLPIFINRLQSEKVFSNMVFSLAGVTREKDEKVVIFSIKGEKVV